MIIRRFSGRQNISLALETYDNGLAKNVRNVIKISVRSELTNAYLKH